MRSPVWRWLASPAVLGAGWLLALFAPLLPPDQALGNRDVGLFHLPLRLTFRDLAAFGPPVWNPWLNGGQPILSNPSYGAFYPPSWLVFAVPPHYALTLMTVLHVALGFAGAWFLARRLGCGRGAAALAAVGFSGCGVLLSLLSALNLLWSLAWFPWPLAWADAALRAPRGERWWRPALLAGGALGLQLLNGEPAMVVISGLALLALAASAAARRPRRARAAAIALRVLVPFAFAAALAAVQLVPTLARLADSPRSRLPAARATLWSLPPARLVEIVFPRFFGDPTRELEGRFFGSQLNDLSYPYLESLYPGLLLAVLGAAALARGGIPRRLAWGLAFAAGGFLALGRHNPLYAGLRRIVPVLAVLRYPEKFAALAVLALVFAGVLGWQRLLDERQAGRPQAADLPLALALVVLGTAATLMVVLRVAPGAARGFILAQGLPGLDAAGQEAGLESLRTESWAAVATAGAVTLLLALCRWRRPSRPLLSLLAVLLLAADLWHYGHGLLRTVPAAVYRTPPPLAASLLPPRDRIFVPEDAAASSLASLPRTGDPRTRVSRTFVARLSPYAGLLWQIPYAFNADFELLLTRWARQAEDVLRSEGGRPQAFYRYLGAWNVGPLLLPRTSPDQPPAAPGPEAKGLRRVQNSFVLPRFRFVPRVTFHPSYAAALVAARAGEWTVAREEQSVRPGLPARTVAYGRPPRLLAIADEGGRIQVDFRAEQGAFFVAAMTFDEGWRARLDGSPVAVRPTAACQVGVALPPGEHRLELRYRDPYVPLGAAASLTALLAGAVLFRWRPAAGEASGT
ncbi:MAG TPA: hypothetical protein VIA62_15710 [Thermoanaerobaculia bacterium]|jgi:hypothetical protein|nr:hypothetical protein [Thermoanaerobaculia bacterium]